MNCDRWPRPGVPVRLQVLVDGSCLVAYVDGEVALSCRMYDPARGTGCAKGALGLFLAEGAARFERLAVRMR